MLWLVCAFLTLDFIFDWVVESLNIKNIKTELPAEFRELYSSEKYSQAQAYLKETTRFGLLRRSVTFPITIGFIVLGGFQWLDECVRSLGWGSVATGLLFIGILTVASRLLMLPFSYYGTFVIEQKYGFNRSTRFTFFMDLIKGAVLGSVLGGLVLYGLLWFFESTGEWAWLYAWGALTVFQLFLMFIAPTWIMPLFNKFSPLQEGELRTKVHEFAEKNGFKMQGIFTMDGSKRSSKANAFFTGFGKSRRIVLFDTLIEKHTTDELVGVLAHEIGHYQLKHILKMIVMSLVTSAVMLFLLSRVLGHPLLFEAFRVSQPSVYASLVFVSLLYSPFSRWFSAFANAVSRKHEFEADAYAAKTTQNPQILAQALKKLSVENLSNLYPHPLKVFLEYSHPPIVERLARLNSVRAHK